MFDIGVLELLVIAIVALIVVGPKDLPGLFRTLGRFTGKMRGMAREFSRAMDEAADEAGVKDMASDLRSATNPKNMGLDTLENASKSFEKWEPGSHTRKLAEERAAAKAKAADKVAEKTDPPAAPPAEADAAAETPSSKT